MAQGTCPSSPRASGEKAPRASRVTNNEQPAGTGGSSKPEGSAPGRSPIVFISDASAETERIGDTLRGAGYVVADVPIANLCARVAAQRPNVVLLDVDAEGVL